MLEPTILADGDALEKCYWAQLQPYFHRYETFWRIHVFPLRRPEHLQFREGIDPEFEGMAMCHYSAYVRRFSWRTCNERSVAHERLLGVYSSRSATTGLTLAARRAGT